MTDSPTDPDDDSATARYDTGPPAPPPTPDAPAAAPATDVPPPPGPGLTAPTPVPPPRPAWRTRDNDGRWGTVVFGVILVAVGLWFFADQTLGLDMPRLRWSELWPVLIIVLGGWIVLGSIRRDA